VVYTGLRTLRRCQFLARASPWSRFIGLGVKAPALMKLSGSVNGRLSKMCVADGEILIVANPVSWSVGRSVGWSTDWWCRYLMVTPGPRADDVRPLDASVLIAVRHRDRPLSVDSLLAAKSPIWLTGGVMVNVPECSVLSRRLHGVRAKSQEKSSTRRGRGRGKEVCVYIHGGLYPDWLDQ